MPEKDRRSSDVFIGVVQDKSLTSGHEEGSVNRVLVIVCGVAEWAKLNNSGRQKAKLQNSRLWKPKSSRPVKGQTLAWCFL